MSSDDKKKALAQYRLQQAAESLEEARYLLPLKPRFLHQKALEKWISIKLICY